MVRTPPSTRRLLRSLMRNMSSNVPQFHGGVVFCNLSFNRDILVILSFLVNG